MKHYITLVAISLLMVSCRSVKKQWVEDNFTKNETVKHLVKQQDSIFDTKIHKIETSVSKLETSVSKNETKNETSSQEENTTISGSINAEDGKEKSVTFGDTEIKTNGASVTFTTSSSKQITKQITAKIETLTKQLNLEQTKTETLQREIISLKSEFAKIVSSLEAQKTNQTQTVKKAGFNFGVWIIIALVLAALAAVWYFKKSIPFLGL